MIPDNECKCSAKYSDFTREKITYFSHDDSISLHTTHAKHNFVWCWQRRERLNQHNESERKQRATNAVDMRIFSCPDFKLQRTRNRTVTLRFSQKRKEISGH